MYQLYINVLIFLGQVTLLIIAVKVFFYAVRTPILEGRFLPWLRFFYLIWPPYQMARLPKDYSRDLLLIPISTKTSHRIYEGNFQHRYVGHHAITIGVSHVIPQPATKYDLGAKITATFYTDDKVILSLDLGDKVSPCAGGVGSSFFTLFVYSVPKDLPRGIPIHCKFEVRLEPDKLASYGYAWFSIRKWNDL